MSAEDPLGIFDEEEPEKSNDIKQSRNLSIVESSLNFTGSLARRGGEVNKVRVVRFPISGTILFFDYPHLAREKRVLDSELKLIEGPIWKSPAAPLTWTSSWDRWVLSATLEGAGIIKVAYDEKLLKNKTCSLVWTKLPWKNPKLFFQIQQGFQRFNHIPGAKFLSRKDLLATTLNEVKTNKKLKVGKSYNFYPETFCLPADLALFRKALGLKKDSELEHNDPKRMSVSHLNKRASVKIGTGNSSSAGLSNADEFSSEDFWIIKPAGSSKGKGIKLCFKTDVYEAVKRIGAPTVVQKYIHQPYLINGKKFDLRLYVLVTSFQPLRVYFFQDGLVRFCSDKYELNKDISNTRKGKDEFQRSHLTNLPKAEGKTAPQRASSIRKSKISLAREKTTWMLSDLKKYLNDNIGEESCDQIFDRIKEIIVKTCVAAIKPALKEELDLGERFHGKARACFELFGFDILLDKNLKPWLLEVNASPSLQASTAEERIMKSILVCDVIYLVGIPYKDANTRPVNHNFFSSGETPSNSNNRTKRGLSIKSIKESMSISKEAARKKKYASMSSNRENSIHNSSSNPKSMFGNYRVELDELQPIEREIIAVGCEEYIRRGHFERIFPPTPNNFENLVQCSDMHYYYFSFFPQDEIYLNC